MFLLSLSQAAFINNSVFGSASTLISNLELSHNLKRNNTNDINMIANMYGLPVKGFDTHYEDFSDLPTGVFMPSSLNNLIPALQTLTSGEA